MKKIFITGLVILMSIVSLSGCSLFNIEWPKFEWTATTFEDKCHTTEDGFVYYKDNEIGVCIIKLPDSEEVEIPQYLDNMPVMQLGYEEYDGLITWDPTVHRVDGSHVKRLIIRYYNQTKYKYVSFPNLETMVYVDILNRLSPQTATFRIFDGLGTNITNVELLKEGATINTEGYKISTIEIPEYVVKIEAGVFDGLKDVVIKTPYESKPDGWEEGWNGDCEVIWGAKLK